MVKIDKEKQKRLKKAAKLFNSGVKITWSCCGLPDRPCPRCGSTLKRLIKRSSIMDEVLSLNPNHTKALFQKAWMLTDLITLDVNSPFTELMNEALGYINRAINIGLDNDSDKTTYLSTKGDILFLLENYEEALISYKKAPESKVSMTLVSIVKTLCALGKYEEAMDLYKNHHQFRNPPSYFREIYQGLESIILVGFGQCEKFIFEHERKAQYEKQQFGHLRGAKISDFYHFGQIFEKCGNKALALEYYDQALRYNYSYPPAIRAREKLLNSNLH